MEMEEYMKRRYGKMDLFNRIYSGSNLISSSDSSREIQYRLQVERSNDMCADLTNWTANSKIHGQCREKCVNPLS